MAILRWIMFIYGICCFEVLFIELVHIVVQSSPAMERQFISKYSPQKNPGWYSHTFYDCPAGTRTALLLFSWQSDNGATPKKASYSALIRLGTQKYNCNEVKQQTINNCMCPFYGHTTHVVLHQKHRTWFEDTGRPAKQMLLQTHLDFRSKIQINNTRSSLLVTWSKYSGVIIISCHGNVITRKSFPNYWPLWGNHRGPVYSPHQGPVMRSFDVSLLTW